MVVSSVSVFGQSGQVPRRRPGRLSVDEAVRLAVAQNLGIRIERLNPEIQDVAIAQTRGAWVPSLLTSLNRTSTSTAPTNPFAGGLNKITDNQVRNGAGRHASPADRRRLQPDLEQLAALVEQLLPDLQPADASSLAVDFTQPLLRNFKIDNTPAAARDQPQGPRERRHDAPADDHPDRAQREERLLGSWRSRSTT